MTCKEMILSDEFMDLIADYDAIEQILEDVDIEYCYHAVDAGYGVATVRRSQVAPISIGYYGYSTIPKLYGLMQAGEQVFDASPLAAMGNIRIQNPPLALQGSGVIMGFVDTGINYREDVFRRDDGSTRILSIWDQTIQTGEPPEGFLYGTEYRREDIDRALAASEPESVVPSTDSKGHGTKMASAAAGSLLNQGLTFRGAAPLADIAVVKLKEAKAYLREYYLIDDSAVAYQENDIMEAVKYLQQMAVAFSRPVVIVIGLGTNMGSHDGTSALDTYLNIVAGRRSRAVVVGGGNEGDKEHHYENFMPSNVEIRVAGQMKGFCAEIWGSLPDVYSVSIRSPGGEVSPVIDFRNGMDRNISFIFERTRIRVGIALVEKDSGDPLIFLRFQDPTPGIWTVSLTASVRNPDSSVDVPPPVQSPDAGPACKGAGRGVCAAAGGTVLSGEEQEAWESASPGGGSAAHLRRCRAVRRGGGAGAVQRRRGVLRHVGLGRCGLCPGGVLHGEAAVKYGFLRDYKKPAVCGRRVFCALWGLHWNSPSRMSMPISKARSQGKR